MRCTDQFDHGMPKRAKRTALRRAYIDPNAGSEIRFLVFDYDYRDGLFAWRDAMLPQPNLVVFSQDSGHSHMFYVLRKPVFIGGKSKQKPINYLNAVLRGFTRRLDADPNYAHVLAKNPLHPRWRTVWLREEPYSLDELASYLHASNTRYTAHPLQSDGGRNTALFDKLRKAAYFLVLKHKREGFSAEAFQRALLQMASEMNFADNPIPLPQSEVRHIAKSVAKFVWEKFSDAAFSARQSRRAKRRSAKTQQQVNEMKAKAKEPARRPMSAGEVAAMLGLSPRSVRRYWSQTRQAYESNCIARTKPWEKAEVSRSTWYRSRRVSDAV